MFRHACHLGRDRIDDPGPSQAGASHVNVALGPSHCTRRAPQLSRYGADCPSGFKSAAGACVKSCPGGYEDTGRTCTYRRQGGGGGS
jgi:hypothetical protein